MTAAEKLRTALAPVMFDTGRGRINHGLTAAAHLDEAGRVTSYGDFVWGPDVRSQLNASALIHALLGMA